MFKTLIMFTLYAFLWFISYLFPIDYSYYSEIVLPSFALPTIFYIIAWTIIYLLIAFSMTSISYSYKIKDIPMSYKISLLINYLFNQSFVLFFFGLRNNFLGFISCIGTFISSLFFYQESLNLKEKSTLALRPYVLLSFFATILSLTIYLLNI